MANKVYISTNTSNNTFLRHYGVKGMKWGVVKDSQIYNKTKGTRKKFSLYLKRENAVKDNLLKSNNYNDIVNHIKGDGLYNYLSGKDSNINSIFKGETKNIDLVISGMYQLAAHPERFKDLGSKEVEKLRKESILLMKYLKKANSKNKKLVDRAEKMIQEMGARDKAAAFKDRKILEERKNNILSLNFLLSNVNVGLHRAAKNN